MRTKSAAIAVLLVASFLAGAFLLASRNAVALPHSFRGSVAGGVAGTTEVYAEIDGVLYGQDSQWANGGYSGTEYALDVTSDVFETDVPKQGGVNGDIVVFWVKNGATLSVAGESATFVDAAGPTTLDLTVPAQPVAAWPQLSEVNPENSVNDFVELYNPGGTDLVLTGSWALVSNDPAENPFFPLLATVVVPAGGYSQPLNISQLDVLDPVAGGDSLKLVYTDASLAGGETIVVDRLEYGNPTKGADAMGVAKQAGATTCIPATNSLCVWDINVAGNGSGQSLAAGQSFHRSVPADTDRHPDWTVGAPTPVYPSTAPPTITVTAPVALDHLAGNQAQTATWTVTDTDSALNLVSVWINYSLTGIAPWTNLFTGDASMPGTQGWTPACSSQDVSTAVVMGEALDPDGNLRSDAVTFRVDCVQPVVASTIPPDNIAVAPTVTIVITFDEDMNEAATVTAMDLDGSPVTPTWTTPNRVARISHAPWADGSAHQFNVTCIAVDTASPNGNMLSGCTYNFNWTVSATANTAPTIGITAPAGGEVWSMATAHDIVFTVNDLEDPDANLLVTFDHSNNTGTSWNNIVSGRAGDQTPYSWVTPGTNCGTIIVRGTVTDLGTLAGTNITATLTLDCSAPMVITTAPTNGDPSVNAVAGIAITFSEAMNEAPTALAVTLTGPGGVTITGSNWDPLSQVLTLTHTTPFFPGGVYTVTIACTATDVSDPGNALSGCPTVYSFSFTAATGNSAPVISLVMPAGGQVWSGGSIHDINWTMNDDGGAPALVVNLTYKIGVASTVINSTLTGGILGYAWTVACENDTAVMVNASATDAGGLTAWDETPAFEIDCAAPRVQTTVPADNAPSVNTAANITITFSESMVTATVDSTCVVFAPPLPAAATFTWSGANATLTINHSGLNAGTIYTVTICAGARDQSDPGLTLGGATFDFTTTAIDTTDPTGDVTFTPANPDTDDPVTFQCPTCNDNVGITSYAWVIRASNNTIMHQGTGTSLSYTFATAGTYTMNLTVMDAAGNDFVDEVQVIVTQAVPDGGGGGEIPWLLILIPLIILVLLILFFLMRKKKKPEEEAPAATPSEEIPPPTEEKPSEDMTSAEIKPEEKAPEESSPEELKPGEGA